MRRMQLLDASFLQLESRQTPMHVAPLALFTLPKGVNEPRFMAQIMEVLRSTT